MKLRVLFGAWLGPILIDATGGWLGRGWWKIIDGHIVEIYDVAIPLYATIIFGQRFTDASLRHAFRDYMGPKQPGLTAHCSIDSDSRRALIPTTL